VAAQNLISYVEVTAGLLDISLAAGQAERVAMHLARTAQLAALLRDYPLQPDDEPAALFCPAPVSASSPATLPSVSRAE
jgi:hypothetical protein